MSVVWAVICDGFDSPGSPGVLTEMSPLFALPRRILFVGDMPFLAPHDASVHTTILNCSMRALVASTHTLTLLIESTFPSCLHLAKTPDSTIVSLVSCAALTRAARLSAFFLRVDRPVLDPPPPSGTPKTLLLAPQQSFDPLAHYAWFYDGSPLWTILGGLAMVGVMLAGVMFPLWPVKLRLGVWYLSVGALGLVGAFIVLAIVRLIFWCITVVARPKAIWIFPNLFEDVGFVSGSK